MCNTKSVIYELCEKYEFVLEKCLNISEAFMNWCHMVVQSDQGLHCLPKK